MADESCFYDGELEMDGWEAFRSSLIRQKDDRLLDQFIDDVAYFPTASESRRLPGFDTGSSSDDITFVSFSDCDSGFSEDSNPDWPSDDPSFRQIQLENPDTDAAVAAAAAGTATLIRVSADNLSPDAMEKLLGDFRCPKCRGVGEPVADLNVRFCKDCDEYFGFDDSMDLGDIDRLVSENNVKLTTKCLCGNDDVDKFDVTDVDDVSGQLTVRCRFCPRSMKFEIFRTNESAPKEAPVCNRCRNCEYDLFEKRYDVKDRVTSFRCLACDEPEVTPGIVCPVCRNDREDRFEIYRGSDDRQIISAACMNCRNFIESPEKTHIDGGDFESLSSDSMSAEIPVKTFQRQIRSLSDVSVGDHVMWRRGTGLCHHAIATEVRSRDRKLTVVHYTGSAVKHRGHYVSVREEAVSVDPTRERIFVLDYETSVGAAETVSRARSRLEEHRYNPLSSNCEHFAYWCKTGLGLSVQAESACRRLWKTCGSVVSAGVREGIVSASRVAVGGLPARRVLGVGVEQGLHRLRGVSGGSGLAAKLIGGAVALDVLLNLALEAGLFAYCAFRARQKYKAGEITREEYLRRVAQTGCECAGGFLGATGGGLLGQLVIPVPFLGSLIGCTLGTLIGRFVGSLVGKKISDKFIDKR